jgi:hypothetical protein
LEELKAKLSSEENQIEEVTYPMIENHFAEKLNPKNNKNKNTIIFDGFPPSVENNLQKFIKRIG